MENQNTIILWDFNIKTGHVVEARRPDLALIDKKTMEMLIIDVAIPGDFLARDMEAEKILKYESFALEISQLWNTRTRGIPI